MTSTVRRVISGLALLLFLSLSARGSEPEATLPLASDDGRYRLQVPAGWTLEPTEVEEAVLAFAGSVPGVEGTVTLALHDVVGVLLSPRATALAKLPLRKEEFGIEDLAFCERPVAHLVGKSEVDGDARVWLLGYLRHKGHGIHLRLVAPDDAYDVVYPAFLEIAASVEADVEPWPPALPATYKSKTMGGLQIAWAPEITGQQMKASQRFLAKVSKEFERYHGKIKRPADDPLTLVLHASMAPVKRLCPESAESRDIACPELLTRRVHTVPGKESFWMAWAPPVRRAITRILLHERYRILLPSWVRIGELEWAFYRERAETKKPVYPLQRGLKLKEERIETFDKLEGFAETDWGTHAEQSHLYVLFFHRGPSKYQKAYKRFLAEMAKTGDWEAAADKHLMGLKPHQIREDALEFLAKKTEPIFD